MKRNTFFGLLILAILLASCTNTSKEQGAEEKPAYTPDHWSANAIIYEVNVRQYTPEGTFDAFREHLPRLKDMGVDILWLMPIHPIGIENRKGELGSYYSVRDYKGVNPEFGTLEDLKELVNEAHSMDMKVILDWVANHSAWDNVWLEKHPDFYQRNEAGELVSPYDWTDVIALNYENEEMQDSMITALKYWIEAADIDGYRCDVAGMVPVDFWEKARMELDALKPVFMLAEDEEQVALLNNAFDMNYAWGFHFLLDRIAKGEEKASAVYSHYEWDASTFPADKYRMNFVSNHDENSWKGYLEERMGDAARTMTVLSWTAPGFPLIYSGEEAGLDKRLRFFDKDTISWDNQSLMPFYAKLAELRTSYPAFWSGTHGGELEPIQTGNEDIFAFKRAKQGNEVVAIFNLSAEVQEVILQEGVLLDTDQDFFNEATPENLTQLQMAPWEYLVYVR